MKKFFSLLFLLWFTGNILAQNNIPSGVNNPPSATPQALPFVDDPSPNYVRAFTPVFPLQDASVLKITIPVDSAFTITNYYDGLRRPMQQVTKQLSPNKKDKVSLSSFDEFGRAATQYLPYVAQTGNSDDGKYKNYAYTTDTAFYKSLFPNESVNYAKQTFDGSPLNRVVKTMEVGNSFTGSDIGKTMSQRSNALTDSVVIWTIDITSEDDIPVKYGVYAAGTLMVAELTDEKGVKTIIYTDELGKKILVKQQIANTPSTGHAGWLCTYYVYDEMSHLRMMIPPKAVEQLQTVNWVLSTDVQQGLCYTYYYDLKGRNYIKSIPGKGKFYTAYDLLGRVVMSQDPNLRTTNQWSFVLYDEQDRAIKSGLITSSLTKEQIFAQATASSSYPTLSGTYSITSEAYFDDYNWIAANGAPLSTTIDNSNINSNNFITSYNTAPEYAQQLVQSNRIRGLATGTKKLILNTGTYLYTANFYDNAGRAIQITQTNYSGGIDVNTVQYSFTGKVLRTHVQHQKSGTNAQTHGLLTKLEYDHAGRLKNISKKLDAWSEKVIVQYSYNELGQVQTKILSPAYNNGAGLETQAYAYNIQGSLVSINAGYVTTPGNSTPVASPFFGEIISYDYGFTQSQANGTVSGVRWKQAGDGITRAYGYTYDNANRLTYADFNQQNEGGTNWTKDKVDYTVTGLGYDANGNILSMRQRGLQLLTNTTIDSLTYQYFSNTNRLQKVTDYIADMSRMGDFKDSSNTNDDYAYDANGNIIKDNNRHLHTASDDAGAVFNVLDKPDSLIINGRSKTYYYYDAGGNLLRKLVNNLQTSKQSNYVYAGPFVYVNDTLQTVFHEEGQISKNEIFSFVYDYFVKDHQGSVRTVLTDEGTPAGYLASMEESLQAREDALFSNIYTPVNTVVNKPNGFDNIVKNHKVSRLNADASIDKKTGPGIVLKVMAGDKVLISTYAFYNTATQTPPPGVNLLSELLAAFTGGVINGSGGKVPGGSSSTVSNALSPNVTNFLNNNRPYDPLRPKAFLNWVLVDNQFNLISSVSSAAQVLSGSSKQLLVAPTLNIPKNGYLYVYVSNESPQDVYFDDLYINHEAGPLVQEQSYYPYGLPMYAITDKAALKNNTPYKYNAGSELEEDGVDYYSTFYRKYDAQIGRFTGVDILAEKMVFESPYSFGANNPVMFNDPSGAKYAYMDSHGNKWHGADIMAGTLAAGLAYEEGFGYDGFGGDLSSGGGGADYSGYWNYRLGLALEPGGTTSIRTQIPGFGAAYFALDLATNNWGFFNLATNNPYNGTDANTNAISGILTDLATSSDEILSSRFFQMLTGGMINNIYSNSSLPPPIVGPGGAIIGTNTLFSLTSFTVREASIPNNGVSDNRVQFVGAFLSTSYLSAYRTNVLESSKQTPNQLFGSSSWIGHSNTRNRPQYELGATQAPKSSTDRAFIENNAASYYRVSPRNYFVAPMLLNSGVDFVRDRNSMPIYGVFSTHWDSGQVLSSHY